MITFLNEYLSKYNTYTHELKQNRLFGILSLKSILRSYTKP